jgi:hypothetical protein
MDAAVRRRILGSNLMKTSDFKPKARNPQHQCSKADDAIESSAHPSATAAARWAL